MACKRLARGLQFACERLAENEASVASRAFKKLLRGLQVAALALQT